MQSLINSIITKLNHLPQPKLNEVLDFVEFLVWQEERKNNLNTSEADAKIDESNFEELTDQLADELARSVGKNVPLLSDYAISRTGIYEEHP